MKKAKIIFTILSYWHMGSGRGEGASFDATVVRTPAPESLPYIPGRTVKGLFREAVQMMEECGGNGNGLTVENLFGSASQTRSRYDTDDGLLRFSSARLPDEFGAWASGHPEEASFLFVALNATKLDESGLADDKSLRRVEACIPLELSANVEADVENIPWIGKLVEAAPFIRAIGSYRHRGLGRVKVAVQEVGQ